MTVKELKDKLDEYGDHLEVRISRDRVHTGAVEDVEYAEPSSSTEEAYLLIVY